MGDGLRRVERSCREHIQVCDPKAGDALIDELFAWYGASGLPDYRPNTPKFEIVPSILAKQEVKAVLNWSVDSKYRLWVTCRRGIRQTRSIGLSSGE